MKCLSLWQPWATLVVIGAKKFETRSWPTRYRGPLLIHASKRRDRDSLDLIGESPFREALRPVFNASLSGKSLADSLPYGAIIGVVNLKDCHAIHEDGTMGWPRYIGDVHRPLPIPESPEFDFGNYAPGRFAWELHWAYQLRRPVPLKGWQGIFNVPGEVVADQTARAVQS
jgi:hypothetical protein